jgi:hypothetical protein
MRYRITLQSLDPSRHITPQTMDILDVSRFLEVSSKLLRRKKSDRDELLFSAILDDCIAGEAVSSSPRVQAAADKLYDHLSGRPGAAALEEWQPLALDKFTEFCHDRAVTAAFRVRDREPVLFAPRTERNWLPYEAPCDLNALYRGYELRDKRLRLHLTINGEHLGCAYVGPAAEIEKLGVAEQPFVVRCTCTVTRSRVSFRPISYVVESVRTLVPFSDAKAELLKFFRDRSLPHEDSAN